MIWRVRVLDELPILERDEAVCSVDPVRSPLEELRLRQDVREHPNDTVDPLAGDVHLTTFTIRHSAELPHNGAKVMFRDRFPVRLLITPKGAFGVNDIPHLGLYQKLRVFGIVADLEFDRASGLSAFLSPALSVGLVCIGFSHVC